MAFNYEPTTQTTIETGEIIYPDKFVKQKCKDFTLINYYIKELHDKNYCATSVTRKIAAIRGWFRWLSANEIITQDPSLGVELPKLTKKLPKVITVSEIETILQ